MIPSGRCLALVVIAVAALSSGCAGTPKHTITAQKALERLDGHLLNTLRAIPGELNLRDREADIDEGSGCTKPLTGSGFTGQVKAHVGYTTSDRVTPEAARRYLDAVASEWKRRSFSVERRGDGVFAHTDGDRYSLTARYVAEPGELSLSGNSPCVWRDGTPRPGDDP